jgi:uncharacterized RmlC-like cupin family protein
MNRAAAITHARAGAEKLWAGTVVIHPKAEDRRAPPRPVESVIYVVQRQGAHALGRQARVRRRGRPGDFIYVPPYVPHQEINASATTEPLSSWRCSCRAARSRWW